MAVIGTTLITTVEYGLVLSSQRVDMDQSKTSACKVSFSDGNYLVCSPNHSLQIRDQSFKNVKELLLDEVPVECLAKVYGRETFKYQYPDQVACYIADCLYMLDCPDYTPLPKSIEISDKDLEADLLIGWLQIGHGYKFPTSIFQLKEDLYIAFIRQYLQHTLRYDNKNLYLTGSINSLHYIQLALYNIGIRSSLRITNKNGIVIFKLVLNEKDLFVLTDYNINSEAIISVFKYRPDLKYQSIEREPHFVRVSKITPCDDMITFNPRNLGLYVTNSINSYAG